jgi:hypothetical protein
LAPPVISTILPSKPVFLVSRVDSTTGNLAQTAHL